MESTGEAIWIPWQKRTSRSKRQTVFCAPDGQWKGESQLAKLFHNLRKRGRMHVLLALHKTAKRAERADNCKTWRDGPKAESSPGLLNPRGQQSVSGQHEQHADAADARQEPDGGFKNPMCIPRIFFGQIGGYHAGYRDRQTGGGKGQKKIVGWVNGLIDPQTFGTDGPGEGNREQQSQQLAENACHTQNGYTFGDGLTSIRSQ